MKLKTIILFIFIASIIFAQKNDKITLIVISNGLNDSVNIFVSGNNKLFGNWNAERVPLEKINDSTWSRTFNFPKGEILEFKFTKGSWQSEALTNNKEIPENTVVKLNSDTVLTTVIHFWKDELNHVNNFHGQISGTVKYFKQLAFDGILPRDVIVWLPPDYYKNTARHYPVLYMQDGQNIFDPATSSFGVDWQIDETADSLIRNNIIAPLIIVGIYNTADRNLDYSPGKKENAYMKFLVDKVKPLIDKNFRTKPGRKYTAVGGSSMGGLISFILVWQYNSVFSKAICMSPALKIDQFDYVKKIKSDKSERKNIYIYIDNGGVGLEERLQPGITDMLDVLINKGFEYNKNLFWVKDSLAQHNEAAWAKRMAFPLKLFFGN